MRGLAKITSSIAVLIVWVLMNCWLGLIIGQSAAANMDADVQGVDKEVLDMQVDKAD